MPGSASAAARSVATAARAFPRRFVKESVKATRKAIADTLKADTGGDSAMSGIGNAKLKVKTSVKGEQTVTGTVTAGKPRGPWTWLEEGTKPHAVGGKFRGARHPGTRGKRTWSRPAVKAIDGEARRARQELTAIIRGR